MLGNLIKHDMCIMGNMVKYELRQHARKMIIEQYEKYIKQIRIKCNISDIELSTNDDILKLTQSVNRD